MYWKAVDHIARAVVGISSVALVLLVVFTGWQVWGRYVLNDTPTWTEKAALLLVLIVCLPMAAVGLRENFHLGIDYLTDYLGPKARRILKTANTVVLGFFGVAMMVESWPLVVGTWGRDIPLLGLPQGLQYAPLILTGGLIVLFMVERVWFLWMGDEMDPPLDVSQMGDI
ncbi:MULTISPECIES: TRAP transporter small permease [Falsihalocynthiibacter]|uniref:TRAP transporter small permease n=1 Tax=Falsihalocynthiibacter TaxID=2854182 RepID=UPI0030020897